MASGPQPIARPDEPRLAFRQALSRYKGSRLAAIRQERGLAPMEDRLRPSGAAEELAEHLDRPAVVEAMAARLPVGSRLALSLFAVTEAAAMPAAGLAHALAVLGDSPEASIVRLLELGLLAVEPNAELGPVDDLAAAIARTRAPAARLLAHPAVPRALRAVRPEGRPPAAGPVGQVREADGLEPLLRLGALWQRAGAEPIRQTQTGALYKRDRERVAEDPVLAGAISDALAPLPDPAAFWLALGQRVGVVERDETGQRITAAPPSFWSDNAFHLPQMIATGWLALRGWLETSGASGGDAPAPSSALSSAPSSASASALSPGPGDSALPYLRPAVLLWLATMEESEWVALDDLAAHLAARCPDWDRERLADEAGGGGGGDAAAAGPATSTTTATTTATTSLAAARRAAAARKRGRAEVEAPRGPGLLASILLGVAYPLGLVRAGEESGSGRRAVQLTPLGRYVLAAGPTPPPRPTFEQFLFVQPNFEVIAYRQGLTPLLVGRLSRFAWWSQIGAALELRLTRESIVLGLDSGLTADAMLEILTRHGQRALPAGVVDAVRTWATRRERVTYYAAATLIEFASRADRDAALAAWPSASGDGRAGRESGHEPPAAVGDRFLLVDDEGTIPFDRFRMAGSRDYRRPPEACMAVEPEGVSLVLDPARADLLIDAELARFADEHPAAGREAGPDVTRAADAIRRRFVVSAASLRRGLDRGLTPHDLADWYLRRTGGEIPPAVRLLLTAIPSPMAPRVPRLKAARMRVLTLPGPALLDGLLQHPATSPCLGERLGPTAVVIPDEHVDSLRKALDGLGLAIDLDGESVKKSGGGSSAGG